MTNLGSILRWDATLKFGAIQGDSWGLFFHYSSLFYHFCGVYSSLFYQKQGYYSSLFCQKVVSLHTDVLYFFSDLDKIIELCIYNER